MAMTTHESWTPDDGQLLRSLRERAGLDRGSFARACTISVAQLNELEQGGHGRFYNDRIKAHTGRNLLKKLGHVPVPRVPPPVETPAPPSGDLAPPVEAVPETAVEPPEPFEKSAEVQTSEPRMRSPWPLRAGIASAGIAALVVTLMAREPRAVAEAPRSQASAPLEPPAWVASTASVPPAPVIEATVSARQPAAAPSIAAPPPATTAAEARCDLPARDQIAQYTPPNALRPSNYVYIEAGRDTSVCVVDAQDRQTVSIVKPGESASVYGTPPFTVQARQWADLRIFYQGVRVSLDTPTPPLAVMLHPR